jgi:hypothetical protein
MSDFAATCWLSAVALLFVDAWLLIYRAIEAL